MDDVDITNNRIDSERDQAIAEICKAASAIPQGKPGDCELCGCWSGRLVGGACAPCRERYDLL